MIHARYGVSRADPIRLLRNGRVGLSGLRGFIFMNGRSNRVN
jgi:hypothetical protein